MPDYMLGEEKEGYIVVTIFPDFEKVNKVNSG